MKSNVEEFEFDIKNTFEKRKEDVEKILKNYPNKIAVIIEKSKKSKLTLPETFKYKFLVNPDDTFGSFVFQIRKRLKLTEEQSLFVFVNKSIPASGNTMGEIYKKFKSDDGFLKILFCEENTFGTF